MKQEKTKWLGLLFFDSCLFLAGLATNRIELLFGVIGLSYYIRKNGYAVLFKAFDEQRQQKRAYTENIMKKMIERK